jgi:hypothetical protein
MLFACANGLQNMEEGMLFGPLLSTYPMSADVLLIQLLLSGLDQTVLHPSLYLRDL